MRTQFKDIQALILFGSRTWWKLLEYKGVMASGISKKLKKDKHVPNYCY